MSDFSELGIEIPLTLLPADDIDPATWAVVAADQYTSQLEYWERVAERVGDRPSTLKLILPEVYLEADPEARMAGIQEAMRKYSESGVFKAPLRSFIYLDRKTVVAESRKGLMVALDLEVYDFTKGSSTLVRATEKTVEERLPPRVKIREAALLELPHVMVLIDDPERRVIEPLAEHVAARAPLYDTELMEGGGHLTGWAIDDDSALASIHAGLARLADPATFAAKYGVDDSAVLLYAMGDGNHSLAAAKVHWENLKKTLPAEQQAEHPARHALVELVNVHDEGLVFEPIHRVAFGVDPEALLAAMPEHFTAEGASLRVQEVPDPATLKQRLEEAWARADGAQVIGFVTGTRRGLLAVEGAAANLAVGSLQGFLDDYLAGIEGSTLDYIHGEEVVETLSAEAGRIGFLLPAMHKGELFKTVIVDGALPRKTFSMGEADEKRYYFEARAIT